MPLKMASLLCGMPTPLTRSAITSQLPTPNCIHPLQTYIYIVDLSCLIVILNVPFTNNISEASAFQYMSYVPVVPRLQRVSLDSGDGVSGVSGVSGKCGFH